MSYEFVSAAYANADNSAITAHSTEFGAVLISEADRPELWGELANSEIEFHPFARVVTLDDYRTAIQRHLDERAQERGYDSGLTCASYIGSTNTAWAAEAADFVAWRDAVWSYAYRELDKVQVGEREQPDLGEFIEELPAIGWPQ